MFDWLGNIFSSSDQSGKGNEPFVTESLTRKKSFHESFDAWRLSGQMDIEFNHIRENYKIQSASDQSDFVRLMRDSKANGMILLNHPEATLSFDFLLEELKFRVLDLGYTQQNADRRMFDKASEVESIERYYLKPKLTSEDFDGPRRQMYGNILVELHKTDLKPRLLKFLSTIYSDRNYQEPWSFDELINKIL